MCWSQTKERERWMENDACRLSARVVQYTFSNTTKLAVTVVITTKSFSIHQQRKKKSVQHEPLPVRTAERIIEEKIWLHVSNVILNLSSVQVFSYLFPPKYVAASFYFWLTFSAVKFDGFFSFDYSHPPTHTFSWSFSLDLTELSSFVSGFTNTWKKKEKRKKFHDFNFIVFHFPFFVTFFFFLLWFLFDLGINFLMEKLNPTLFFFGLFCS